MIKRENPNSENFEVYSHIKENWKMKRLPKTLIIDNNGQITVIGLSENYRNIFSVKEVFQILLNN